MRGDFTFAVQQDGVPVTLLYWSVDEATALQVAGADGGRPSSTVAEINYTSLGVEGADWKCYGLDATFARLDGSLTSSSGPWTNLATGLADASAVGVAKTLWVRCVAKRWAPDDSSPRLNCSLSLGATLPAGIEDDDAVVEPPPGGPGGPGSPIGLLLTLTEA